VWGAETRIDDSAFTENARFGVSVATDGSSIFTGSTFGTGFGLNDYDLQSSQVTTTSFDPDPNDDENDPNDTDATYMDPTYLDPTYLDPTATEPTYAGEPIEVRQYFTSTRR